MSTKFGLYFASFFNFLMLMNFTCFQDATAHRLDLTEVFVPCFEVVFVKCFSSLRTVCHRKTYRLFASETKQITTDSKKDNIDLANFL